MFELKAGQESEGLFHFSCWKAFLYEPSVKEVMSFNNRRLKVWSSHYISVLQISSPISYSLLLKPRWWTNSSMHFPLRYYYVRTGVCRLTFVQLWINVLGQSKETQLEMETLWYKCVSSSFFSTLSHWQTSNCSIAFSTLFYSLWYLKNMYLHRKHDFFRADCRETLLNRDIFWPLQWLKRKP